MSSLVPSFPSLVLQTMESWTGPAGTRLVISDSAYELSCAHVPQAGFVAVRNGHRVNRNVTQGYFCQLHDDGY